MKTAISYGVYFCVFYFYYAYTFYVGSWFVQNRIFNHMTGNDYTGGDITTCFFGVLFGAAALGIAIPNIKSLTEGMVAGKFAFDTIDRIPEIQIDKYNSKKLPNIRGNIEFRNVTFSYPTKKDIKILDGFSATFEAGKTTAIVGASGSGKSTII